MKKNIFFGLSGGLGPVLRCLSIAESFRNEGHTVFFSMYGASGIELITELGYVHLPDDDPTMPSNDQIVQGNSMFYNLDHYYAQNGLLDEIFTESWIRHRIRMIEQAQIDLVFADMSPHSVIAARYLGIPVVSITQACFHPMGERVYAWGEIPRNLPKVTPVMNKILRSLNLPTVDKMEDLNHGDLDIVPSIPEIDPIADSMIRYVGPMNRDIHLATSEWMVQDQGQDPIILVYPGRLNDTAGPSGWKIVEHVYQAFANQPVQVYIASNEESMNQLVQQYVCENIKIISYFSESMLDACDLFIHHGGHGSCLSAVMAGVPSLIIPTQTEREYNARKMYQLGVAEYILPDTFTAENLYRLTRFVMEDEYRENAVQLRAEINKRQYGGSKVVFEQSKRLLEKKVTR